MIKTETNKIYLMDCVEGMKTKIDADNIDIIITSPPYNIGIKYNSHKDNMPFDQYLDWMEEFGKMCAKVLKENGSLFFNIGDKASDEFRSFEVAQRIAKSLKLQNIIHWVKSLAVPEHNINIGHYKPINSTRFLNNLHEFIFHFTKTKNVKIDRLAIGVPYADKSNINRWKHGKSNGDKRDRGNIWYIPYDTVQSEKDHPTSFPKKLSEMCIKLHGFNNLSSPHKENWKFPTYKVLSVGVFNSFLCYFNENLAVFRVISGKNRVFPYEIEVKTKHTFDN